MPIIFDKEDVLNNIVEQELEMLTGQIAHAAKERQIIPSLELFEHADSSENHQLRALICSSAGEPMLEALQVALCRTIEPALSTLCAGRRSPPIPLPVVSEFLAGAYLTLFKWWVAADMPYPPEQMESIFQQLVLPGVWAMLKEK